MFCLKCQMGFFVITVSEIFILSLPPHNGWVDASCSASVNIDLLCVLQQLKN